MRRAAIAVLLITCLMVLMVVSGCLFGKKGGDDETATSAEKAPGLGAGAPGEKTGGAPGAGPPGAGPAVPGGGPPSAPAGAKTGPAAGGLGAPPGPAGGPPAAATKAGPAPGSGNEAAAVKQAKAAKAAGDYNKALQALGTATGADACWIRAWILAEQGQKEQAAAEFGKFLSAAKPGDPRVAQAKAALGRLGAAAGITPGPAAAVGGPKAAGPK